MISIEDVIGMTGLTRAEVDAVAEHEHMPESAAAALASYLMTDEATGAPKIAAMIRDDIRAALARGDCPHAADLLAALRIFLHDHPLAGDQPSGEPEPDCQDQSGSRAN